MDFSVMFLSYAEAWKEAKLAEDLGYTNAWFADMQLHASDVYATMALAAQNTDQINLGTAVSAPPNRIAPLTASSIATINQPAPGRVTLGLGVGGFSARRSMGMKPMTVKRFREYVEQVRGLLEGEDVLYREGDIERWIRLLQHDFDGYINIEDPIPIYFASNGPRMLDLTGQLNGRWLRLPFVAVSATSPTGIDTSFERSRMRHCSPTSDARERWPILSRSPAST